MPYKIRTKKKHADLPIEELKSQVVVLKKSFSIRPKLIIGVIVALAVILISIPAYTMFMRYSEERAWGLEVEASRLFHEKQDPPSDADKKDLSKKVVSRQERLIMASVLYDEILTLYPESRAAEIAQFEGGNVYFDLEKYDLAEKRYLAFLKKETDRKDLLPIVHLRLAYLYEKQKKDAQALDHFSTAYEWEGGFNKDQAGFEKGALLEKIGKKAEAIALYKKVSETFTTSPWGTEAKARLFMLDPTQAVQATSTPVAAAKPPVPAAMPVVPPAKFSPPPAPVVSQKVVSPAPPTIPPAPIAPKVAPTPALIPTPDVPPAPATQPAAPPPSTSVPLEISPEQLKQLREKGSLTIPLPPQTPPPAPLTPS